MCSCFFFQAEDGIRDRDVTGVQTCALPILAALRPVLIFDGAPRVSVGFRSTGGLKVKGSRSIGQCWDGSCAADGKIGRASCRERVEMLEVDGLLKKKSRRTVSQNG